MRNVVAISKHNILLDPVVTMTDHLAELACRRTEALS